MRLAPILIPAAVFGLAAGGCLVAASFAVTAIEENSEISVRAALDGDGLTWAEVQADGLTIALSGTAPSEAQRFHAITAAGGVVDAARVIDQMKVRASAALAPPRFSAEILRNDSGISIIGLIPASIDRDSIVERLEGMQPDVADLLESADYPVPRGWQDAMGFALTALALLPRAKVSVDAGHIAITAIADSREDKARLERALSRAKPPDLRMSLNIAAPRPVITPFTLRFVRDADGARFDACSADDQAARDQIVEAARAAGAAGEQRCTIGMGVPSPDWADAASTAISALRDLGEGSVTFSDADVTLIAAQGTDSALFDRVVGELETGLPEVFALHAVLPEPEGESAGAGPPEFTATLSPEGSVQLRGRLSSENLRSVVDSFARARFGSAQVRTAARVVDDLPRDWPVRVLAGLEALSLLRNGVLVVTPDTVTVQGIATDPEAREAVARLLADKLGETETFGIDIAYREPPPPRDQPLGPEACEEAISTILLTGKINFEPGSATVDAESARTMDDIAEVLGKCGDLRLEIQGHTDSQGRESMNQSLSQERAQSVLNALRSRRILTSNFIARGYGETRPIADNGTEEGREANRRIEFHLIRPEDTAQDRETTLEAVAQETPIAPQADPAGQTDGGNPAEDPAPDDDARDTPDTSPEGGSDQ
ncbi:MAG: OmpA family protein [Rhodobacteraceae bacterium]|nr:OmpA family protein [Paracoccaceae bacterium]